MQSYRGKRPRFAPEWSLNGADSLNSCFSNKVIRRSDLYSPLTNTDSLLINPVSIPKQKNSPPSSSASSSLGVKFNHYNWIETNTTKFISQQIVESYDPNLQQLTSSFDNKSVFGILSNPQVQEINYKEHARVEVGFEDKRIFVRPEIISLWTEVNLRPVGRPINTYYYAICPMPQFTRTRIFLKDVASVFSARRFGAHFPGSDPSLLKTFDGVVPVYIDDGRPYSTLALAGKAAGDNDGGAGGDGNPPSLHGVKGAGQREGLAPPSVKMANQSISGGRHKLPSDPSFNSSMVDQLGHVASNPDDEDVDYGKIYWDHVSMVCRTILEHLYRRAALLKEPRLAHRFGHSVARPGALRAPGSSSETTTFGSGFGSGLSDADAGTDPLRAVIYIVLPCEADSTESSVGSLVDLADSLNLCVNNRGAIVLPPPSPPPLRDESLPLPERSESGGRAAAEKAGGGRAESAAVSSDGLRHGSDGGRMRMGAEESAAPRGAPSESGEEGPLRPAPGIASHSASDAFLSKYGYAAQELYRVVEYGDSTSPPPPSSETGSSGGCAGASQRVFPGHVSAGHHNNFSADSEPVVVVQVISDARLQDLSQDSASAVADLAYLKLGYASARGCQRPAAGAATVSAVDGPSLPAAAYPRASVGGGVSSATTRFRATADTAVAVENGRGGTAGGGGGTTDGGCASMSGSLLGSFSNRAKAEGEDDCRRSSSDAGAVGSLGVQEMGGGSRAMSEDNAFQFRAKLSSGGSGIHDPSGPLVASARGSGDGEGGGSEGQWKPTTSEAHAEEELKLGHDAQRSAGREAGNDSGDSGDGFPCRCCAMNRWGVPAPTRTILEWTGPLGSAAAGSPAGSVILRSASEPTGRCTAGHSSVVVLHVAYSCSLGFLQPSRHWDDREVAAAAEPAYLSMVIFSRDGTLLHRKLLQLEAQPTRGAAQRSPAAESHLFPPGELSDGADAGRFARVVSVQRTVLAEVLGYLQGRDEGLRGDKNGSNNGPVGNGFGVPPGEGIIAGRIIAVPPPDGVMDDALACVRGEGSRSGAPSYHVRIASVSPGPSSTPYDVAAWEVSSRVLRSAQSLDGRSRFGLGAACPFVANAVHFSVVRMSTVSSSDVFKRAGVSAAVSNAAAASVASFFGRAKGGAEPASRGLDPLPCAAVARGCQSAPHSNRAAEAGATERTFCDAETCAHHRGQGVANVVHFRVGNSSWYCRTIARFVIPPQEPSPVFPPLPPPPRSTPTSLTAACCCSCEMFPNTVALAAELRGMTALSCALTAGGGRPSSLLLPVHVAATQRAAALTATGRSWCSSL